MWLRNWTEQLVNASGQPFRFSEIDKVVAVRVKNQGTATVLTGWNNESTPNEIGPNSADNFDAGDSGVMIGELKIGFTGAGTNKAVLLVLKNVSEIC